MTKKKPGIKTGRPARHGGYSLLTRGFLPERRRYVGHYLSAIREGLIHDLAKSEEDLSTAQRILVDRLVTFLGCVRLIEEHAREHGLLDSKGRLTHGMTGHYLSFNRHIKEILALLGIEKRQVEETLDLARYIQVFDERKAQEAKKPPKRRKVRRSAAKQGAGQGEGQGEREK